MNYLYIGDKEIMKDTIYFNTKKRKQKKRIIIMNRKASNIDGLGMMVQYVLKILNINARTYCWIFL